MPSIKQGGGYTLTFSKKNKDIKDLLDLKKEEGFVVTEYIINAIRFYEDYKDSVGTENLNLSMVEDLVNKKMELFKKEILSSPSAAVNEQLVSEAKEDNSYLENVSEKMENKFNMGDD
ncbi:hypothetical protein [Clostridium tagluense]|uniref:hypothetical protein n=1 Tax=Clostridium tagluense TaxID=360422 RepID=UPI001CF38619|nr:hypothetical protein [Clostridium tagluense]MCB2300425.1 hypothetical protein [Clostridium tagluense]